MAIYNNKDYHYDGLEAQYGLAVSFNMAGKYPAITKRIFDTLAMAKAFADDKDDSAIVGLLISVTADTIAANNGVYVIDKIGDDTTSGVLTKLGESGSVDEIFKMIGAKTTSGLTDALSSGTYVSGSSAITDALLSIDKAMPLVAKDKSLVISEAPSGKTIYVNLKDDYSSATSSFTNALKLDFDGLYVDFTDIDKKIKDIQKELDTTEESVGLSSSGTHISASTGHYISAETTVEGEIKKLDENLFRVDKDVDVKQSDDKISATTVWTALKEVMATALKSNKTEVEGKKDNKHVFVSSDTKVESGVSSTTYTVYEDDIASALDLKKVISAVGLTSSITYAHPVNAKTISASTTVSEALADIDSMIDAKSSATTISSKTIWAAIEEVSKNSNEVSAKTSGHVTVFIEESDDKSHKIAIIKEKDIQSESATTLYMREIASALGASFSADVLSYSADPKSAFISAATSFMNADQILDAQLRKVASASIDSSAKTIVITYDSKNGKNLEANIDNYTISATSSGTLHVVSKNLPISGINAIDVRTLDDMKTVRLKIDRNIDAKDAILLKQDNDGLKALLGINSGNTSSSTETYGGVYLSNETYDTNGLGAKFIWGKF